MHIYFIGIGGTAIGPLSLIAHQKGYKVSGSDKQDSQYLHYLAKQGITSVSIGNDVENIKKAHAKQPVDWVVYSSAVAIENPDHPEIQFANENGIRHSKRDELLNKIITDSGKKLVAIAGTHGKTTTTAMTIWLFKELGIPVSYSVGAKIPFGDMGHYDETSEYFVYECDEFDYNFLAFHPHTSMITGVDYDHHEIFKTRQEYVRAFQQFIDQSGSVVVWNDDLNANKYDLREQDIILHTDDTILNTLSIVGNVNRRNAFQVMCTVSKLTDKPLSEFINIMQNFPGLSRRFEKLANNLYTDYAHTPPKVAGCLQLASEVSRLDLGRAVTAPESTQLAKTPFSSVNVSTDMLPDDRRSFDSVEITSDRNASLPKSSRNVVVVYEPLTNRRQHYVKHEYKDLFKGVKKLYWVPSYLAREDPNQPVLSPAELIQELSNKEIAQPAELNDALKSTINEHLADGDLVVCMSGGGGHSLDEWLRANFTSQTH